MKFKKEYFQFGQVIPGLTIRGQAAGYPVMNEREVRAIAGLMLAVGLVAFALAFFQRNFFAINMVVVIFFIDFIIRVLWGTRLSPFAIIARLIVGRQEPEWVGAIQKRFAWSIGVLLAGTMIVLIYALGVRGPINLAICSVCLFFMWMESAFGICVGCKIYYGFIKIGIIKEPVQRPACPGGVCQIKQV